MEETDSDPVVESDRVFTVPNLLSALRLALVPVFLWVLLVEEADGWAFAILFFSGLSDWADGKIARLLDQSSKLGALLDPAADRLYMLVVPIGLAVRGIVPWWLVGLLVGRDVLLLATAPLLRSRGITALPTIYIGKAATFALMYGFPMILAGQIDSVIGDVFYPCGWAFMIWGTAMYLWSFVLYWIQAILVVRTLPPARGSDRSAQGSAR
ncbi:CDP-diacylglycerol--glycerol-3-phosphate 3-phosphatidyltransferase [Williamsia sp. 1138]|uniref:CDP-alcohol phosphatidyltransferase family protein n=1 Tax=Gordonia rubripertincta TaxID=36822 RepID=A0ABT4MV92_GORRU|nr:MULTISPECIES: CDP-alcohol phosphatidyltransferase family protein [Mycobacteriales]MCZ4550911.1 CDP-alcohol phosphatidyltransferase family protein [Gordonia rubripertincta]OZG27266.1 CDP-diacylglycerol--glycerol-3-phosphate 3-phosphatidyltransferase [Williamsia sp. 1138]